MRRLSVLLIFFGLSLFGSIFYVEAASYENLKSTAIQGETVVIYFSGTGPTAKTATFNGQPISFFKYKKDYAAVFGIAASQKIGSFPVKIVFSDNSVFEKNISVKTATFKKIVLPVPEKLEMTPKTLVSNLQTQNAVLNTIFTATSTEIFFNQPFGLPLANNKNLGSRFGEICQTGDEQIRHMGLDFTASTGKYVYAINDGIVTKNYIDPIYGNAVLIDHGHGIFSAYFHLDKVLAKQGGEVKKGVKIGIVGQSGYATGPHLHLSIKINGVSVDPLKFVRVFK